MCQNDVGWICKIIDLEKLEYFFHVLGYSILYKNIIVTLKSETGLKNISMLVAA